MTQKEKDLNIEVTPLIEDVFYVMLALDDKISSEQGEKIFNRIRGRYSEEEYYQAIVVARQMVNNIQKYGVACAAWE